jgi:hypothetical protein
MEERPLDGSLLLFECLLDPAILEELTARGQEVVREQQDRLGGSAEFWTLVLGKALRPLPKLPYLLVVNHEEPSSSLQRLAGRTHLELGRRPHPSRERRTATNEGRFLVGVIPQTGSSLIATTLQGSANNPNPRHAE